MKKLLPFLVLSLCSLPVIAQSPANTDLYGHRAGTPANAPSVHSPSSPAAGNEWIPVGPWGGDVTDLAANPLQPETLFAAVGSPFISTDGGDSWAVLQSLSDLAGGPVNCIEAAANGILIATGTYAFSKVFRSDDGGSTWVSRSFSVSSSGTCIAMDPNDTNTMYVGLNSNTSVTLNKVIIKSVNGGINWTAIDMTSVLPIGYSVVSIAVDPSNPQTLFAIGREGFSNSLLVASFDGGVTWEDRTGSLPSTIPFNAVAIGGQNVYVAGGQFFGSQFLGVYKSTDYGLTWNEVSSGFPNKASNAVAIDPLNTDNLFVATEGDGIYSSTDGGATWNYTTNGAGENGAARTLLFLPGASDTVFAGYLSIAVCRSYNAGANWEYANAGIATLLVNDVEVSPVNTAMVLASFEAQNSGGCFLSPDSGHTWSLVTGLPGTRFSKVGFLSDGALVAWSNGPTTVAQEGLYKSTDNGATWDNMGPFVGNLFETEIFALATSATDPGVVFIGGNNFGVNGWASVIHRSTDSGQTWDNIYVGAFPDNFESVRYLFIDPNSNDQVIYAAMKSEVEGSILKSTDGGDTWTVISDGITPDKWYGSIVCDPGNSQKLIAGAGGYGTAGGVWLSEDGGGTWSKASFALGTYSKVQDLCINPDNTDVMYAATGDDGVYISTNGGHNWVTSNEGMPAANVTGFSNPWTSGSDRHIFASTYTNSIFTTVLYDPSIGIGNDVPRPEISVWPNPSDGNITLQTGTAIAGDLTVEVYNSAGMLVGVYHPDVSNGTEINLRINLPAGVYLGRIISRVTIETFRVCIVQ
jgi:photosystem II stability/assembly factor-like uncharacterized protein